MIILVDMNKNLTEYLFSVINKSLKPCPFCGHTDVGIRLIDDDRHLFVPDSLTDKLPDNLNEEVRCFTCGCNMSRRVGVGVVNEWNRRAENTK
jgi:hypothetical protein